MSLNRRQFLKYGSVAVSGGLLATGLRSSAASPTVYVAQAKLEPFTYSTNWYAQAEHGGFYQALATGLYRQAGLDVTIKMGGPGVNITQLLVGGACDAIMGSSGGVIKSVAEGIPSICVAAMFQKDPQILLAHPGTRSLAELRGRPIFISQGAMRTYWPFLRAKFGFTDDQTRPYNFNPGPFLADKTSAQQGYLTSEPFAIQKQAGFKPEVFLIADAGYSPYSTTIETTQKLVADKPDVVQRFVDASIKGWYSYLKDPKPANELIKRDNPEMKDDQLAYSLQKLQEYGILISGDAVKMGIGAMTEARWKTFFDQMVAAKVFDAKVDYQKAFTLKFVNKGVEAYRV